MPVKGRLRLPEQPEQPAEVAERASRRSYVRRLLDLEAERARLRHDAGVRADQEALQAEQKRREQVRAEASSAPKRRPPARELPASATRARAELPHAVLVAVPEGLRGGMIMQVPVAPEGRAVEAEIPEGLGPGDEFYIGGGKDRPPVKQVTREQAAGAAVAIQSASRGHQARIRVSTQHAERREAAVRLQALLRGRQARSDIDTTKQLAATKMQAHYRGWQAREDYYDLLDQTVAAEHIQAVVRGTQTRQRASEQQAAAVAIQSRFRGNQERMLLSLPLRTSGGSSDSEDGLRWRETLYAALAAKKGCDDPRIVFARQQLQHQETEREHVATEASDEQRGEVLPGESARHDAEVDEATTPAWEDQPRPPDDVQQEQPQEHGAEEHGVAGDRLQTLASDIESLARSAALSEATAASIDDETRAEIAALARELGLEDAVAPLVMHKKKAKLNLQAAFALGGGSAFGQQASGEASTGQDDGSDGRAFVPMVLPPESVVRPEGGGSRAPPPMGAVDVAEAAAAKLDSAAAAAGAEAVQRGAGKAKAGGGGRWCAASPQRGGRTRRTPPRERPARRDGAKETVQGARSKRLSNAEASERALSPSTVVSRAGTPPMS